MIQKEGWREVRGGGREGEGVETEDFEQEGGVEVREGARREGN